MSTHLTIYLDDAAEARLRVIAKETGRSPEELAASATSEEAMAYFRGRSRSKDPAPKPYS